MSETVHTKEFDLSAPFAQPAEPIVIQPIAADAVDNSAAINAVGTVVFVFVVIALLLVFLSHPKGGRK